MFRKPPSDEERLVNLLGSAASYNDKGAYWYRHSAAQVEQMQAEFHAGQQVLAGTIGASRLGDALFSAIESGVAAQDGSGEFVRLAERVLGVARRRP